MTKSSNIINFDDKFVAEMRKNNDIYELEFSPAQNFSKVDKPIIIIEHDCEYVI